MVLFVRMSAAPATVRHFLARTRLLVPKDGSRRLTCLSAANDSGKLQDPFCPPELQQHGTSAKSLKYWNGLQCQTRGLFGQCRTGGLAVLKQALKPGVSNTCWVPSAGYCDSSVFYNPPQDETGLTYINDLSPEDEAIVQAIAYQELKSLLDRLQIPYTKSGEPSRKFNKVFGSSLCSHVEHDHKVNHFIGEFKCPAFYFRMCKYLNSSMAGEVFTHHKIDTTAFRDDANKNYYSKGVNLEQYGPKVVGAGLRRFLRELREPLLSVDQLKDFPPLASLQNIYRLQILNYMYLIMRKEHRDTLQALVYVCSRESEICGNRDPEEQAAVLYPDIIRTPDSKDAGKQKFWAEQNQLITRIYIDYSEKLWTVSPNLINQVRHLYNTGKAKVKPSKPFPWAKKEKFDGEMALKDSNVRHLKSVGITVQAQHLENKQKKVEINEQTTALDVVKQFDSNPELSQTIKTSKPRKLEFRSKKFNYLYEIGGNIGYRIIDPEAKVLEVYKMNPKASFVIMEHFAR
ncbi:rho GTPase-activating protein 18-like [Physella acuta]|uniref:rho GTPase-activating protein 18-like n=1 Tax=Physella acuta TaxID=109671 RepID=UPI0027DCD314|nr:rho GTPase-activating protein 18-like [Physella acuta]